jgi:hypothetical protein
MGRRLRKLFDVARHATLKAQAQKEPVIFNGPPHSNVAKHPMNSHLNSE